MDVYGNQSTFTGTCRALLPNETGGFRSSLKLKACRYLFLLLPRHRLFSRASRITEMTSWMMHLSAEGPVAPSQDIIPASITVTH